MKESALRDMIAQNIGRLKSGLTLLKKEQYIPAGQGTTSFIDLYAKDEQGRHVLIELKRSEAASRQALHEVTKYAERIKSYFGVKNTELLIIIASTDWGELLLPFSRYTADSSFSVEGFRIVLNQDETDFTALPVSPLPLTQGRFIAPWHNVYWYTDKAAMEQGIRSIQAAYANKGLEDFVLVTFYLPDPHTPQERQTAFRMQVAEMAGVDASELSPLPEFPVYEYMIYSAWQILSRDACLHILQTDADAFSEALEVLPSMEEEEALCYLHESIESIDPTPERGFYEIGYPSKFAAFMEAENCQEYTLLRYGSFKRNSLLSDAEIYHELAGSNGESGQGLTCTISMNNTAQIKTLHENLHTILAENPPWQSHMQRILAEIQADFPEAEAELHIFNPCTGILTIYYAMTKENGASYLPCYQILIKNPQPVRLYFGALQDCGSAMTFQQILHTYYHGSMEELLLPVIWGGKEERDNDILEALGLMYRSFRVDMSKDVFVFHMLRDDKWKICAPCQPEDLFMKYVESNRTLVTRIIQEIRPHDLGNIFQL